MRLIPPAKNTDAEDVVWGLQTADTLWKRGERIDAVVWLRRAAQAAGDASDDDRALELARFAAELTDWMANSASVAPAAPAPIESAEEPTTIDAPLDIDIRVSGLPAYDSPVLAAPALPSFPTETVKSPRFRDEAKTSEGELHALPPAPNDVSTEAPPPHVPSVPPADVMHAGIFNPWDESGRPSNPHAPPPPAPMPAPAPAAPSVPAPSGTGSVPQFFREEDEEEVVTSVRSHQLAQKRSEQRIEVSVPVVSPPPPAPAPPAPPAPPTASLRPSPAKPPPLPPRRVPPPVPPRPQAAAAPTLAPAPLPTPVVTAPAISTAVPPSAAQEVPAFTLPAAVPAAPPPPVETIAAPPPAVEAAPAPVEAPSPVVAPPPPAVVAPVEPAPAVVAPAAPAPAELDLEDVEAFSDLPDDARVAFANAATLSELAEGEEVSNFALAFVLEGAFDVAATMVDAPAVRLDKGAVLRARGTTDEGVPMRLICAGDKGRLATWSASDVDDAFRSIPWVEDDLRAAADRIQTLVGITIGPLGERLDAALREQIVGRLDVRPLQPGEVVVEAGCPVPGLMLVGVGELELVQDGKVQGAVGSGEFLFAGEVLGAGAAPVTARAGAGGALIMFGDRMLAHELLVTCPPLVEVLAGM
ncbi:putative type IV pilus assembly FimV-related transmembrane protein [Labilithrix luteola]|uniref:Putative type IV pilus assembly FimV-related transmembrane protein n=1 Tax=Labilithrix luteola TaxID=1391654 RepID=A0A0K1PUH5_9BACT|nr:hypothetical protein [Labilithrix luteola]AKU97177.1 putative type IV pilus assembly FimV-related transmembrane protein [Labilithrix luteola]